MPITMGEKIRIILGRREQTIAKLAASLGQSRQNLTNKIIRDNFSERELRQIAEALNCDFVGSFTMRDTGETI